MDARRLPGAAAAVCIVDDDASVRDALTLLLRIEGFLPHAFSDGPSFLHALDVLDPVCVLLDLHLPNLSGLDVLRRLSERHFPAPVLMMSGCSDIASAVGAMKFGAMDFLEKPFSAAALLDRVREIVAAYQRTARSRIEGLAGFFGSDLLTGRERDVLQQIARGASNKEAGRTLGISPRTVEVHRARIMDKLGAKNAADLMRIVLSDHVTRPRIAAS